MTARSDGGGDGGGVTPLRSLARPDPEHKDFVVGMLERALARAKAGDVAGLMLVEEDADGDFRCGWSPAVSLVRRIGSIRLLEWSYLNNRE